MALRTSSRHVADAPAAAARVRASRAERASASAAVRSRSPSARAAARRARLLGIHLMTSAPAREGRRLAELQREVEALAEQQHAVGLGQHLGERAEARIGDAARALHADHRHAARRLERRASVAHRPRHAGRADQDQRARARGRARLRIGAAVRGIERNGSASKASARRQRGRIAVAFEHIGRQARDAPDRAGPSARCGSPWRSRRRGRRRWRKSTQPCTPAPPSRPAASPGTRPAELVVRRMAGQQHDGRLRPSRGVERRHRIGVAGTAGDERDADLAGEPRLGVGHVHGCWPRGARAAARCRHRRAASKTGMMWLPDKREDALDARRLAATAPAHRRRDGGGRWSVVMLTSARSAAAGQPLDRPRTARRRSFCVSAGLSTRGMLPIALGRGDPRGSSRPTCSVADPAVDADRRSSGRAVERAPADDRLELRIAGLARRRHVGQGP